MLDSPTRCDASDPTVRLTPSGSTAAAVVALMLLALVAVAAVPVQAEAFELLPALLAYEEDYAGETAFPLTPEVDTLGASAMSPVLTGSSAYSFTGSSVLIDLTSDGDGAGGGVITSIPSGAIGERAWAARGRFAVVTPPHSDPLQPFIIATFDSVPLPLTGPLLIVALILSNPYTTPTAQFGMLESLPGGSVSHTLSLPEAAALAAGAEHAIELVVDQATMTASATLQVTGFAPIEIGPLALALSGGAEPTGVGQGVDLYSGVIDSGTSEFESFEIFVAPGPFVVDTVNDEPDLVPGDGACLTVSGHCSLRAAIQESNSYPGPNEVVVPAGHFVLTRAGAGEDGAATGDLDIWEDIVVTGAGRGVTVVDGSGLDRVFQIFDGTQGAGPGTDVLISGMTIRGGSASTAAGFTGGGIENEAFLRLERCSIEGNKANLGGGLMNRRSLDMDDCTVENNHAVDLGFTNAHAGGIATASISAGGTDVVAEIRNSAIYANTAVATGGIEFGNCTSALLENSTVVGNSGTQVYIFNCPTALRHATVSTAAGSGVSAGSFSGADTVEFANSVVEGAPACSLGTTYPAAWVYTGNNASSDASCGFVAAGDVVTPALGLGPVAVVSGSIARVPDPGSPLIDAADTSACPADDQVATLRPIDGDGDGTADCDLGAIEVPEPQAGAMLIAGLLTLSWCWARRRERATERGSLSRG